MNHTTPTTWHDLADQLTADQRARLAAAEDMPDAELLAMARHWADYAQLQADLAGVPAPAGAVRCSSWFRDGDQPTRAAYKQRWIFGGGSVEVSCDQAADGATGPWRAEVAVDQGLVDMSAAQAGTSAFEMRKSAARQLAAALTAAADAMDGAR